MFASVVLNVLLAVSASSPAAAGVVAPASSSTMQVSTLLTTPQFRRYGVADGVPSGAIYAAAQDHNGIMWFATQGGLVRYDGVSMKVYRHAANDPQSMPVYGAYEILIDRDNRVWVACLSSGLAMLDESTGHFRHWSHDDAVPASLSGDEVWAVAQTSDGTLWVGTQAGLDRMRPDGNGFDHVSLVVNGTADPSVGAARTLLAEPNGDLWIGTENGFYRRKADGVMTKVVVDPSFHGDVDKSWRIDDSGGDVRFAVSGGLLLVGADGIARPFAARQLSSQRVVSSTRDTQGRLWIGTADGIWLSEHGGELRRFSGQPLLPGGLPGNKVWQTTLDAEGGLWIALDSSNIGYLPPDWNGFARFTHVPDDPNSLSGIAAISIHPSRDGKLWVGGENGWVDKLDMSTGQVQHVVQGIHDQVVSLAEDARGRLWIDHPPQLHVFDHGKLTEVSFDKAQVTRPVSLCIGDDGRVYFASWSQGLFVVDPDSLGVSLVPSDSQDDATKMPDQISSHGGRIWYASGGGLQQMDGQTGKLHFVPGVPRKEVLAFTFDDAGFWLGTWSTLEHYKYVDGRATRDELINYAEVFSSDLSDIHTDDKGRLWVFANPGLLTFDRTTHQFISFGPAQGLSNANFASLTSETIPNGTMFASNNGGLVAFDPDRLLQSAHRNSAPPLTLAYLNVQRHGEVENLPLDGRVVRLGWRDRGLRVGVRYASYINPAANHYRFRLYGFDNSWVDADNRGERDFAGLEAGEYTLVAEAAGDNGKWVRLVTPLRIHVESPPWTRWWAWLTYALLLALFIGWIFRNWRRRLAQRHRIALAEQQKQMAEAASAAKTKFLATLSHEIRTPMTGVMGMAELLLSTKLTPLQHDYTQAMQRSGSMLLKLLNDSLDLARIEAGRLELEPAPFDPRQLLRDVAQLEQGLAHARHIAFVLEMADDLPEQLIGDVLRIKQVLLNLSNNALKFTEHGKVTLSAQRSTDGLVISISDTGPGIPEASQSRLFQRFEQEEGPQRRAGSGLGLAICRELVDMMGGSIELESRLGHGSTFHVRLPLGKPEQLRALPSPATTDARAYKLLLVEDDTIVAAVISGLLEHQGHAVAHVGNGLAAMAELAQSSFDAVLLDLDLPGVDGFQIARLIRQREPKEERMPIVAVTARSGSEDEIAARVAGMDGFLRKPLSGEQLAAMLAKVVQSGETGAGTST
ncbi:ATP-binding protein [Rhodanobacter sp. L36]|uniref:hybrid sensor histidine kinase/response regulator n=1 Tax=Rhodanobacter sp. L36 TaxID=1747221 RepID=UPI00131AE48C|nr:ATP-binding protein [Rhodanobacter sp. L36]